MSNTITLRARVMSALAAAAMGSLTAVSAAAATDSNPGTRLKTVQLAQYGCQMFGPYATMRRANEVANEARSYGYSAAAFHNGDGYYVRVC